MNNITFTLNNKNYKRVSKVTAKKLFNNGVTIGILPCKVRPLNPWIDIVFRDNENNFSFDKWVNAYSFYNCNYSELGKYPAFYVEV